MSEMAEKNLTDNDPDFRVSRIDKPIANSSVHHYSHLLIFPGKEKLK